MTQSERDERLKVDLTVLQAVNQESTILDFQCEGDPPTRYTVTFRGKGIMRGPSSRSEIETVDLHRCEIRMPFSYPDRPPDIRWLTPIFHPNISFSGMIRLKEIGLPWDRDLGLDVICERLWDVARLAYIDLDRASNYAAKSWLQDQDSVKLPVDARPLRGTPAAAGSNVIRYQRRKGGRAAGPVGSGDQEVLYIGEDTPTPPLPRGTPSDDDDVLYIGDE